MTHEQKPESATGIVVRWVSDRKSGEAPTFTRVIEKQRNREAAEFRTREAQASDLAFEISDWESYDDNEDIRLARAHPIEAEALGAAEQNRKDAEGAEEWRPMNTAPKDGTPILAKMVSTPETFGNIRSHWSGRFVVVQHEGITASGFDLRWRVACPVGFGGIPDEWFEGWRPVDRPANVAALEARVKELEGEVEQLKKPELFVEDEDAYSSPKEALESYDPDRFQVIRMTGFAPTGFIWAFSDGENIHEFATEDEARAASAAAIREGGEHE